MLFVVVLLGCILRVLSDPVGDDIFLKGFGESIELQLTESALRCVRESSGGILELSSMLTLVNTMCPLDRGLGDVFSTQLPASVGSLARTLEACMAGNSALEKMTAIKWDQIDQQSSVIQMMTIRSAVARGLDRHYDAGFLFGCVVWEAEADQGLSDRRAYPCPAPYGTSQPLWMDYSGSPWAGRALPETDMPTIIDQDQTYTFVEGFAASFEFKLTSEISSCLREAYPNLSPVASIMSYAYGSCPGSLPNDQMRLDVFNFLRVMVDAFRSCVISEDATIANLEGLIGAMGDEEFMPRTHRGMAVMWKDGDFSRAGRTAGCIYRLILSQADMMTWPGPCEGYLF